MQYRPLVDSVDLKYPEWQRPLHEAIAEHDKVRLCEKLNNSGSGNVDAVSRISRPARHI